MRDLSDITMRGPSYIRRFHSMVANIGTRTPTRVRFRCNLAQDNVRYGSIRGDEVAGMLRELIPHADLALDTQDLRTIMLHCSIVIRKGGIQKTNFHLECSLA